MNRSIYTIDSQKKHLIKNIFRGEKKKKRKMNWKKNDKTEIWINSDWKIKK